MSSTATRPIVLSESDVKRFRSKLAPANDAGCTLWTGHRSHKDGYGRMDVGSRLNGTKRSLLAHRISYTIANGPIPQGMTVDHICHTHDCVAPTHLRLATNAENNQNRDGAYANSKSGMRGVILHKASGLWRAEAMANGEKHHLGYYKTPEAANDVLVAWRREHMPFSVRDAECAA